MIATQLPMKLKTPRRTKRVRRLVQIVHVTYAGDYRLDLEFNDGTKQQIDFEPFLRHAKNPDIHDFLDLEKFRSYRIEYGDLVWGDMDLCFPIMDLYHGKIS